MIIDHLGAASRYTALHPHFDTAFAFLKAQNPLSLPPGEITLMEGALRAIIIDDELVKASVSLEGFECHRQHIDIQVVLKGTETVGWKALGQCQSPKTAFDPEKDVQLFSDPPSFYFQLPPSHFGIYFPHDVHAPMIGEGRIRKIVFKVAV